MNTFEINHLTYEIRFSEHADLRMQQRKIDQLQVISAIYALGSKRIEKYNNSDKDFAVIDKVNDITVIANIVHQQVVIITLLNKSDCLIKQGTDVVEI